MPTTLLGQVGHQPECSGRDPADAAGQFIPIAFLYLPFRNNGKDQLSQRPVVQPNLVAGVEGIDQDPRRLHWLRRNDPSRVFEPMAGLVRVRF